MIESSPPVLESTHSGALCVRGGFLAGGSPAASGPRIWYKLIIIKS